MLHFVFPPQIQALIDSGIYEIVRNKTTGELLGIVRDKATGKFVKVAIAAVENGIGINPLMAPVQIATSVVTTGAQMAQTHLGFQKTYRMLEALQSSVEVLQSTTAVVGVGVAGGVVLSAVNLWQIMKLREDVKQLRLEVKGGFIDLRKALQNQGKAIIDRIDEMENNITFQSHRNILIQAYGLFSQAINCLKFAMKYDDLNQRNDQINIAKGMLFKALAAYDNPLLLSDACAAGFLRRRECVWAINQAITMTDQLQGASEVVSHRLYELQNKIRQDTLDVIELCESEDELKFIFPEIIRIKNHDLAVLQSWQNHVDWMRSLSPEELKELNNANLASSEIPNSQDTIENVTALVDLPEQLLYDKLIQKSHFLSLRDQLRFSINPNLRRNYESYISERATASDYKALAPSNWQAITDLTVANLYWYFKVQQGAKEALV